MKARIAQYWNAIRASYWFVPAVMTLGAIALSFVTTALDSLLIPDWTVGLDVIRPNTPDGARAVLGAIAGSMITVAGVTFSITIAVVAYSASQLGPRVLTNFMQDTSNKVTLGTFVATFVYCLLILRTIHGGDGVGVGEIFVPHIGILVALVLTLASTGVLIFFFHHVPQSIQSSEVAARIGRELEAKLAKLFPVAAGEPRHATPDPEGLAQLVRRIREQGEPVPAVTSGYIQHRNDGRLLNLAVQHGMVLSVARHLGDFVGAGQPLLYVDTDRPLDDTMKARLRMAFAQGRERTAAQDVMFLVQQLIQVAARALSPGINDPYTAMDCMNWLGSGLLDLAGRDMPDLCLYDEAQQVRLVAPSLTFAGFADTVFDQLRPYVSTDRNASVYMMTLIERVAEVTADPVRRELLIAHAAALRQACTDALGHQRDMDQIESAFNRIVQLDAAPQAARIS